MRRAPTLVVTSLERADVEAQRWHAAQTPAARFAAVEMLREGFFALHGRPDERLARVLVAVDFQPREDALIINKRASGRPKDVADLSLLGARLPPHRAKRSGRSKASRK